MNLSRDRETDGNRTVGKPEAKAVKIAMESGICRNYRRVWTGKTTIINTIMTIFQYNDFSTAIAAPTGRQQSGLRKPPVTTSTPFTDCWSTVIPRRRGQHALRQERGKPLRFDAVIIDEASMIDIMLMKGLLDAIPAGTRLIIVGMRINCLHRWGRQRFEGYHRKGRSYPPLS